AVITLYIGFDDEASQRYVHGLFTSNGSLSSYMTHDIKEIDDYIVVVFWSLFYILSDAELYFQERGFLRGFHWTSIIGSGSLGLQFDVSYKFMAYAAYNIVRCLYKNAHMSERFHRQHMQLFRALVLQAITPFITSYAPIGLCGILPFIGFDFPIFSVLVPPLCAFHPVLDGVIMIVTVSQFRNTLVNWLRCRPARRNSNVIIIDQEEKDGKRKFTFQM
ncbi:hypothetical protein PENTCL1PPCAC_25776, partial [Pristionchus entomophagus]